MIDLIMPGMHLDFAPFAKGGWRQLHRRPGDLLLIFVGEYQQAGKQQQAQEQIPPTPLFQRGRTLSLLAVEDRA